MALNELQKNSSYNDGWYGAGVTYSILFLMKAASSSFNIKYAASSDTIMFGNPKLQKYFLNNSPATAAVNELKCNSS